eukprot:TRINITY_DN23125_c0_g1_i2.p1 TRINITY_DN23125_c0_g1~~TRINITY_DN23125_c0_g1_i2.p1  ORF type:complete len:1154 (+),score=289.65 TRINITY_DN23125_c0_g1_i2:68-3529(+)
MAFGGKRPSSARGSKFEKQDTSFSVLIRGGSIQSLPRSSRGGSVRQEPSLSPFEADYKHGEASMQSLKSLSRGPEVNRSISRASSRGSLRDTSRVSYRSSQVSPKGDADMDDAEPMTSRSYISGTGDYATDYEDSEQGVGSPGATENTAKEAPSVVASSYIRRAKKAQRTAAGYLKGGASARGVTFVSANFLFNLHKTVDRLVDQAPALHRVQNGVAVPSLGPFPTFSEDHTAATARQAMEEVEERLATEEAERIAEEKKAEQIKLDFEKQADLSTSEGGYMDDGESDWDVDSEPDAAQDAVWRAGERLRASVQSVLPDAVVTRIRNGIKDCAKGKNGGFQLKKFFAKIDEDRSGSLDLEEVRHMIRKKFQLNRDTITNNQISRFFEVLDTDGSGEIKPRAVFDFAVSRQEFVTEQTRARIRQLNRELGLARLEKVAAYSTFKTVPWNPVVQERLDTACIEFERLGMEKKALEDELRMAPKPEVRKSCEVLTGPMLSLLRWKLRSVAFQPGVGYNLEQMVKRMDRDGSGDVDFEEFRMALRHIAAVTPHMLTDEQLNTFFQVLDEAAHGKVTVKSLYAFAVGECTGRADTKGHEHKTAELLQQEKLEKDLLMQKLSLEAGFASPHDWNRTERVRKFLECLRGHFGCLNKAYEALDPDGLGMVSFYQLQQGLKKHEVPWQKALLDDDLRGLFKSMDLFDSGSISRGELLAADLEFNMESEAPEHVDEKVRHLSHEGRRAYFSAQNSQSAFNRSWWNSRKPPRFIHDLMKEDPLPVQVKTDKMTKIQNERLFRDSQKSLARKHAKLEKRRQEEPIVMQEATFQPELDAVTKRMTAKGYLQPGAPGYDEQYMTHRVKVKTPRVEVAKECTFVPALSDRTKSLTERRRPGLPPRKKGDEVNWHARLGAEHYSDRLGCKTDEHVQERLHGPKFMPTQQRCRSAALLYRSPEATSTCESRSPRCTARMFADAKVKHVEKTLQQSVPQPNTFYCVHTKRAHGGMVEGPRPSLRLTMADREYSSNINERPAQTFRSGKTVFGPDIQRVGARRPDTTNYRPFGQANTGASSVAAMPSSTPTPRAEARPSSNTPPRADSKNSAAAAGQATSSQSAAAPAPAPALALERTLERPPSGPPSKKDRDPEGDTEQPLTPLSEASDLF